MPDDTAPATPPAATDLITEIGTELSTAVTNGAEDVETFFGNAASYFSTNITPELSKIVTDSMAAAETAYAADSTVDKYAFALAAAGKAAAADGVAFVEADFNYAVEAVVQLTNQRQAA